MENKLAEAIQHHEQGRLEQAALIYQSILKKNSSDVDALHLLGVIAHQRGVHEAALGLIGQAIALNPNVPAFHCNMSEAYRALGQFDRAAACCRTAMRLQPKSIEAGNNLGLVLLAQGQYAAAVTQFQEVLQSKPDYVMTYNNLGNAFRLLGDPEQAIAQFRRALELKPNLPEAHSNLGQLLLERNDLDEALHHCREAVRLKPNFPEAHSNLGNVLREQGQLDEAKACYTESLRLNPNLGMTYNNMGQALQEEGQFDEAAKWYQQALQRDPNSARIHCNFASLLVEQEHDAEAITRYEIALRIDPTHAETHCGLGAVLREQGQPQKALACYREAIRLKPGLASAHSLMGHLLEELGHLDEAEVSLREAIKHDSRHAAAIGQLATLRKSKLPAEDLDAMRQLLAQPDLPAAKRSVLSFGLAQVLDATGSYAEAAELLQEANAIRKADWEKKGKGYFPADHTRYVDRLIATFTPEFFERVRGFGLETVRPIFIVGLPRSATTLTEQILASHSQVFGAGELRFAREGFDSLPGLMNQQTSSLECLSQLDQVTTRQVAQRHLDRLRELNDRANRVVDKMPDNYLNLGFLQVLFPKAQFIHTRRDVRDVAVSCWMTNFRQLRWACDQEHILSRFREYQRVMEHWRKVLPVPVLEVDYEQTVSDLEGVARRLVDWCGLEWEPACLDFHQTQRSVRTASVLQVRQPIYTRSVARWKHYEHDLATLFSQLSPPE